MSDLFHEGVPNEFIDRVFAVMAACHGHTFQILTKRPERMREWIHSRGKLSETNRQKHFESLHPVRDRASCAAEWPLPNVHLGVSVESSDYLGRIHELINTQAAIRFLSLEPLLGRLENLRHYAFSANYIKRIQEEAGHTDDDTPQHLRPKGTIDWVIVGGESGNNARPCQVDWIRDIISDCADAGVPCFVKQLGARPFDVGRKEGLAPGVMLDAYNVRYQLKARKGDDASEWPKSLQVQEFPNV
jgi:protein gp37